MNAGDLVCWVALNMVQDMTARQFHTLVSHFQGDVKSVFSASEKMLRGVPAMTSSLLKGLLGAKHLLKSAAREIEEAEKQGIECIRLGEASYPPLLKEIFDPPPVIYVKGRLFEAKLRLAVVGTRQPSPYGREVTEYLTENLSKRGVMIVSGLAMGIDRCAHESAIRSDGVTVAVVGNGLAIAYPPTNRRLYEKIPVRGAIISEFPLKSPPLRHHFPRRNRVISGLCHGVLVIEAPRKSGALITARFAAEQGRDVFCVPGRITSPVSAGTNRLIQDGAKLVMSPEDILEEFKQTVLKDYLTETTEFVHSLSAMEREVLHLLEDTHYFEQLLARTKFEPGELSQILLSLEMNGCVSRDHYHFYRRKTWPHHSSS